MKIYIPFEVKYGEKKGIWQIDVTQLSTLELMKLKEVFKGTEFSPTISSLDKLIYNNMDEFNCSTNMFGNGYRKEQKRNNKIAEHAKKKKVRRREYDKYKR